MNRTIVNVRLKSGEFRTVSGYDVAPGLAVHRAIPKDEQGELTNDWCVTHLASGSRVGGSFRLRKDAERAGKEYGPLTDWTVKTLALTDIADEALRIRERILAESSGLPIKSSEVKAADKPIQETTPFSNEPVRAKHTLYRDEVAALNRDFVKRFEYPMVRAEIEVLTERIKKGEWWLIENRGKTSVGKIQGAEKFLEELRAKLARVRYENELPAEVLGFVTALVNTTTAFQLKIPGAYVRVVIPDVLTFEADLVYEDIPF